MDDFPARRRAAGEDLPPERLGALLTRARLQAGLARFAAARGLGVSWARLRAWERGHPAPAPDDLDRLLALYGVTLDDLVPERVPLVVAEGTDDEIIESFVAVVRASRGARPGSRLRFRADDLHALAEALRTDADDVEEQIARVTGCTAAEAAQMHRELLRRRVLVPVAGLAAGAAAFTGVAVASTGSTGPSGPGPVTPADIATPAAQVAPSPRPTPPAPAAPPAPVTTPATPSAPGAAAEAAPPAADPPPDVFIPDGETFDESDAPPPGADPHTGPPDVFVPEGETFVESDAPPEG
jgi:transcriptional regulator with XRE-family HTH domain